MNSVILHFEQPHAGYLVGEYAGFTERAAHRILQTKRNGSAVASRSSRSAADAAKAEKLAARKRKTELVPVTFKALYGQYRVGETAGFPRAVAQQLVGGWKTRSGHRPPVADYFKPEKAREPKPVPQKPEAARPEAKKAAEEKTPPAKPPKPRRARRVRKKASTSPSR